jgi:nucleoside-diphosphate-sugar epimerase
VPPARGAEGDFRVKALVTGAAGFIGSTLAERLVGQGADVVGIDCFTDYYPRALKERNVAGLRRAANFRLVDEDLLEVDLASLLDGVTHIFHLAAQAGVRKSWGRDFDVYVSNNIGATQRLLEACTGRRLDRFVYASTSSVYGDEAAIPMREDARLQPVSPYGVSKLAAEHLGYLYHVNHGLPFVALRYFTVYGPRQRPDMGFHRFLTAAMDGRPLTRYGDGEQTRDFTFVADAVSAAVAAGSRGSQ